MLARMQAIERALETTPKLEGHAIDRMFQLQDRLHAMETSRSWRITAPLRWAAAKRTGLAAIRAEFAYAASEALLRFPRLRLAVRALARMLRLMPRRPTGVPVPAATAAPGPDPASMSAGARRVRELLARKED
jgi:hypothetical protein